MCRSKSPLFRYNCRKNCQLASAKLTVFYFILTKNRQILSALQFLLSCFIRISEKKFLAYLPYSRDFLSLRRMKERRKNRHLFIEGAPSLFFCCLRQTMLRYSANEVALCANDVLLRKNCGRDTLSRSASLYYYLMNVNWMFNLTSSCRPLTRGDVTK